MTVAQRSTSRCQTENVVMSDKRFTTPKNMLLTPNQARILELVAERDELRAEVQRLTELRDRWYDKAQEMEVGWDKAQIKNERLRAALAEIRTMVDRQAEDERLWFINCTASEAYLQQELRNLHDRVERCTQDA